MNTIIALWMRNIKAFVRDKTRLLFSIFFPFFFIFVFSAIFQNEYIDNPFAYMLAGVIVASVFDFSLRISSSTIDDMASGFMKEVLVSPVSRLHIATGQFLSSATIAAIQGVIIFVVGFYIVGFFIEDIQAPSVAAVVLSVTAMAFIGLTFAGLGLFVATNTKDLQTFQVISVTITMPMTFLSGAYIPVHYLPDALRYVSIINPMTYAVALFRAISLEKTGLDPTALINEQLAIQVGSFIVTPLASAFILLIFGLLSIIFSTLSFMRTDFSRINRNKETMIDW